MKIPREENSELILAYFFQGTNFSKSFCDDKGVFDGHRGRIRTLWCIKGYLFLEHILSIVILKQFAN